MRFRQYSCSHCRNGRRPAALMAICVAATGQRYRLGCLCQQCATGLTSESLHAWAHWHVVQILSYLAVPGKTQGKTQLTLAFEGASAVLNEARLRRLVEQIEISTAQSAQGIQEGLERAGYHSPPANELLQRLVLNW